MSEIESNFRRIINSIPQHVSLVVAAKGRNTREVEEVIDAGARIIGENYTHPEATSKINSLGEKAQRVDWHLIGHLQKNDINKALPIFDVIQTVESLEKAQHIDKRVKRAGKRVIPVLIEINSAREDNKHGLDPDFSSLRKLISGVQHLEHIRIEGLMTMGPFVDDPQEIRPYFRKTKELFDRAKRQIEQDNCRMNLLSMGMSDSYRVAIEQGANMIRIGRAIFGPRQ